MTERAPARPRRLPPDEGPVIMTGTVARMLRMRTPTAVAWLQAHGVRPLPDCGRRQRWSRAAVLAAIERHSTVA